MELLLNLGLGFETALTPINILYCFIGVLLGTLMAKNEPSAAAASAEPAWPCRAI